MQLPCLQKDLRTGSMSRDIVNFSPSSAGAEVAYSPKSHVWCRLEYASEEPKRDRKVFLEASTLSASRQVVVEAVMRFRHASEELKRGKEFIVVAVKDQGPCSSLLGTSAA